jgi:imidazolonepropionase-like amidohydrolase
MTTDPAAAPAPTTLRLRNVTLIDGTGRPAHENTTVVVRQGRISYIGADAGWAAPPHEPETVLNLTGRYLIPGMIDLHVHLAMWGQPDSRLDDPLPWSVLLMLRHAQNTLAAGITSIRDVGGRHGVEFFVRRAIQAQMWAGPRMLLAGRLLSITSWGAGYYDGMYREADGVDDVRKAVREQIKGGADLIKVLATGAVLDERGDPGAAEFNPDEIQAAVHEARKFGKYVAAHAHGIDGIRNAVAAGVRTIEHGTYLHHDPHVMERMAGESIFLVPTLKAIWELAENNRPGVPDWIIQKMNAVREDHVLSVRRAIAAGVPIAMGTDAATPYNFHGHNAVELQLMADAGMTPMQALTAATLNAARAVGWSDWLGSIEVGKVADMVIVRKNPLADLRTLADPLNIELVIQDGRVVARRPDTSDHDVPERVMASAWVCCGIPTRDDKVTG